MKRVGYLYEKMMTLDNFILAEKLLGVNKPDNKLARYFSRNAEKYGEIVFNKVLSGEFQWHKPKERTIVDNWKGKTRNLKIPCLEDQVVQLAWLNIAMPYIEKRNYYYNCGSIPNAGQTRCVYALKKWLKNPSEKHGATADIRKFYDTCPHDTVRKGLYRIFKDKVFVEFAMGFVASMSDTDVGIAIGYPTSHWLANVALMQTDHEIKRLYPKVHMTRYMDDVAMTSPNKRTLKKAMMHFKESVEHLGMSLKKWSIFKIKGRGLKFLSYRFFHGYNILAKKLMVRIARRMKKVKGNMTVHTAYGIISYFGILKHCNSYHFRQKYVYPYVSKRDCCKIISKYALRQIQILNEMRMAMYERRIATI